MAKQAGGTGKPGRFGPEYRLQGLSVRQIVTPFEEAVLRVGDRYYDRDGKKRKFKPGRVLNALVLAFLESTPEEQERVALHALARLEAFLDGLQGEGEGEDSGSAPRSSEEPERATKSSVGHPAPRPGSRPGRRKSG